MQNFFDFTDKVVLVTGASSGIGRATAEFFGKCGAKVAVSYLSNKDGADAAVAAIEEAGLTLGAAVGSSGQTETTKRQSRSGSSGGRNQKFGH